MYYGIPTYQEPTNHQRLLRPRCSCRFVCAKVVQNSRKRQKEFYLSLSCAYHHIIKAEQGEEDKEQELELEDLEGLEGSGSGDFESLTRDGGEIDLGAEHSGNASDGQTEGVSFDLILAGLDWSTFCDASIV